MESMTSLHVRALHAENVKTLVTTTMLGTGTSIFHGFHVVIGPVDCGTFVPLVVHSSNKKMPVSLSSLLF